ncbi:MAG TPA: hypothetical protein VF683_05690, partial [Chthoniobacterales bacterium]
MRWLAGGVTFVCASCVIALLWGSAFGGVGKWIAGYSLFFAAAIGVVAGLQTRSSGRGLIFSTQEIETRSAPARFWFWFVASCFAFFAFRSFCWLIFADGNQLKVQSANNLGDLALHITYIKNFALGVPLWPDNPIHFDSRMRYPAGTDLFNALLLILRIDLQHGLIWAGIVGSAATFYALYRWGGVFTVAGFLFNGGLAGLQLFTDWRLLDFQGENTVAWKNLPLAMLVTQRGLLYALPAGLLLLCHWRAKYVAPAVGEDEDALETNESRALLPFWVEVLLYASMPLFHMHTFMALSLVAAY